MEKRLSALLLSATMTLVAFTATHAQPEMHVDEEADYVSKDATDFAMAMVLFNSYRYLTPEAYKKKRAEALWRMENSASNGLATAQYFLGHLYLTDSLIRDQDKGVALLKKAAYQGNKDAMSLLDERGVAYEIGRVAEKKTSSGNMSRSMILLFSIGQIGLAVLAHYKVALSGSMTKRRKKNNHYLAWLLPVFGPVMAIRNAGPLLIPLKTEDMNWIEGSMNWLLKEFKIDPRHCVMVTPSGNSIPVDFDYSERSAREAVAFIAHKMRINKGAIELEFYSQAVREVGSNIFTASYDGESNAAGLYLGKNDKGKYNVALERSQLNNPVKMIATLSHELAHIKLLGEGRLPVNDEYLTDLVTLVFGFGIFSANSAFQFNQETDRWSYSRQGYLSEQMYGYALSYFAYLRNESSPEWAEYLSPTIKEDFERGLLYLRNTKTMR